MRPNPVQVVVSYWEIPASKLATRVEDLLGAGVRHVTAFVPWSHFETDITHRLLKFLNAALERDLQVLLIPTPEVGLHFPFGGVPKEFATETDHRAQAPGGGDVAVFLPPVAFALPSLSSPELQKRYFGFLTRFQGFLADYVKQQPKAVELVSLGVTGSFWKYFRHPRGERSGAFTSACFDQSRSGGIEYRRYLDEAFNREEFKDSRYKEAPSPFASPELETENRKSCSQLQEQLFRLRVVQTLKRKGLALSVHALELYTPEADPAVFYETVLGQVEGRSAGAEAYTRLVDSALARAQSGTASFVHWTSLGGFHRLSDAERAQLLMRSVLRMGAEGGGLLVDDQEFLRLSKGVRARSLQLGVALEHGRLKSKRSVAFWTRSRWTAPSDWVHALEATVPHEVRVVSGAEDLWPESRLLVTEPDVVLTRQSMNQLLEWVGENRTWALPRNQRMTDAARVLFAQALQGATRLQVELGVSYEIYSRGSSRVVIYSEPQGDREARGQILVGFLAELASVAEASPEAKVHGSGSVTLVPGVLDEALGESAWMLFNASSESARVTLEFRHAVRLEDLAPRLNLAKGTAQKTAPLVKLELEVPAYGVLPLGAQRVEEKGHHGASVRLAELSKPVRSAELG